jgi:hypothetical protein
MSLISVVNRANPLESITNILSASVSGTSAIKSLTSQLSQYIYILTDTVAGPGGFPAANANLRRVDTTDRTPSNMSTNLGSNTVDMAVYTSGNNTFFILGGTTTKISQIGNTTSNYSLIDGSSNALSSKYLYVKPSTTTLFYTGTSDSKVSNTTLSIGSSPDFTLTWGSGSEVNSNTDVVKILSSPTGNIYYIVSLYSGSSPPTFYFGSSDGTGYTQVTGVPFNDGSTSFDLIIDAEFDSSGNVWFSGRSGSSPPFTYFLKKFVFNSGSTTAGSVTSTKTLTNIPARGLFIENTTGSGCYSGTNNVNYINPINTY